MGTGLTPTGAGTFRGNAPLASGERPGEAYLHVVEQFETRRVLGLVELDEDVVDLRLRL